MNYQEHHLSMDRLFPVVLYKEKIPVEFITYPAADIKTIRKMLGQQIQINRINKFDFLLKHRLSLNVRTKEKNYSIHCPKPSAFLYHKGTTFMDRENKEKQAKDLYYMYFILRYAPDIDLILSEISHYRKEGHFMNVQNDIHTFFERVSSQGCVLVEQENGPDEYIDDVRQDIFDRFKMLRKIL